MSGTLRRETTLPRPAWVTKDLPGSYLLTAHEPILGEAVRTASTPPVFGVVVGICRENETARVKHAGGVDTFWWPELRPESGGWATK